MAGPSGADKYTTEVVLQRFRGELTLLNSRGGGEARDSFPDEGGARSFSRAPAAERRPALSRRGGRSPNRRRHPVLNSPLPASGRRRGEGVAAPPSRARRFPRPPCGAIRTGLMVDSFCVRRLPLPGGARHGGRSEAPGPLSAEAIKGTSPSSCSIRRTTSSGATPGP